MLLKMNNKLYIIYNGYINVMPHMSGSLATITGDGVYQKLVGMAEEAKCACC
jgi:hypothetical protein